MSLISKNKKEILTKKIHQGNNYLNLILIILNLSN